MKCSIYLVYCKNDGWISVWWRKWLWLIHSYVDQSCFIIIDKWAMRLFVLKGKAGWVQEWPRVEVLRFCFVVDVRVGFRFATDGRWVVRVDFVLLYHAFVLGSVHQVLTLLIRCPFNQHKSRSILHIYLIILLPRKIIRTIINSFAIIVADEACIRVEAVPWCHIAVLKGELKVLLGGTVGLKWRWCFKLISHYHVTSRGW